LDTKRHSYYYSVRIISSEITWLTIVCLIYLINLQIRALVKIITMWYTKKCFAVLHVFLNGFINENMCYLADLLFISRSSNSFFRRMIPGKPRLLQYIKNLPKTRNRISLRVTTQSHRTISHPFDSECAGIIGKCWWFRDDRFCFRKGEKIEVTHMGSFVEM
jgi:hypothetical protein